MRMKKSQGFSEELGRYRDEHGVRRGRRVPKRAVNVTVQEHVLAEAKAMQLNLSQILEDELQKRIKAARAAKWAAENREFIDWYNDSVERNGAFGQELLDLDEPPI
jgi:antitoxin CcdA